jgi:hypothetical protein
MIIRILHEGQYEIQDESLQRLNAVDEDMFAAAASANEGRFRQLLDQALGIIRREGRALAVEDLRPSDLVLPSPDSTLEEVRALLAQEGLINSG